MQRALRGTLVGLMSSIAGQWAEPGLEPETRKLVWPPPSPRNLPRATLRPKWQREAGTPQPLGESRRRASSNLQLPSSQDAENGSLKGI